LLLGNQKKKKTNATFTKEFFGHNGPKVIGFKQQFLACHQKHNKILKSFCFPLWFIDKFG